MEIRYTETGEVIGQNNPLDAERMRLFNKADDEKEASGEYVEVGVDPSPREFVENAPSESADDTRSIIEAMAIRRGQQYR